MLSLSHECEQYDKDFLSLNFPSAEHKRGFSLIA